MFADEIGPIAGLDGQTVNGEWERQKKKTPNGVYTHTYECIEKKLVFNSIFLNVAITFDTKCTLI